MPWLFRYFWFVAAAAMLINITIWRRRLAVVVQKGNATEAELRQFTMWAAIGLVGGPILLGLVSIAAGWESPFCAGFMRFTDGFSTLVSLITLAGWLALLWWVWRGNGADFLSRVAPALNQRPDYDKTYPPHMVRLFVTVMVVAGGIGTAVMWRTMPALPEMGCHVPPVAV